MCVEGAIAQEAFSMRLCFIIKYKMILYMVIC
jgi:hypothetical protein